LPDDPAGGRIPLPEKFLGREEVVSRKEPSRGKLFSRDECLVFWNWKLMGKKPEEVFAEGKLFRENSPALGEGI